MRRSLALGLLLASALASSPAWSQDFGLTPPPMRSALKQDVSSDLVAETLKRADAGLSRRPGPLPVVHTEGTLPGKGIREASTEARQDLYLMRDFAYAWRFTGDRRYLDAYAKFLSAWLDVYKPSFNPIDETHFDTLVVAYDLTEADLPPSLRQRTDAFLRAMAEGYLDRMEATPPPKNAVTNWQSHRIKVASLAAFKLGDKSLIDRAEAAYRRQLAANIQSDGSVHDFHERDAIHYVTYDLEPLMVAALAAKRHGRDWYGMTNPSGTGLKAALKWLEPYAKGDKTHDEFVRSTVAFDAERNAAGQEGYSGVWKREKGVSTFALATLLDESWRPVLEEVSSETGRPAPSYIRLYGLK